MLRISVQGIENNTFTFFSGAVFFCQQDVLITLFTPVKVFAKKETLKIIFLMKKKSSVNVII